MNTRNKVTLIGNIGNVQQLKTLDNGSKLIKMSVATRNTYKDKNGETVRDVDWHNITAWNNLAEIVDKYIIKGDYVIINGQLKTDKYVDKNGDVRYFTYVKLLEIDKLISREGNAQVQVSEEEKEQRMTVDHTHADDLPF